MKPYTSNVRLRLRAPLWIGLLPLILIIQVLFPNKVWIALLVGLGGAWLVAYVWVRSLAANLRLEREMRFGWAHVGDRLEERFTLTNAGLAPALWVEIADQSTLPDYRINQVTAIGGEAQNSWDTRHTCTRRGLFTLGPTRLRSGDPLGLFEVTIDVPGSAVLMVTPPVVPLPAIEVAPGGRAGEGQRTRPDPLERTVSSSGVRAYHFGDPLRWIHWPTSIRQQELFVRNFDSTPASDWWIFLDLESAAQTGQGWASTEEHGVILAASLADRGLHQGHAVGLSACGEELIWLPPSGAGDQRLQILRQLALARPGNTPLAHLLETARPALRRGASLILITPNTRGDWLEPLAFYFRSRIRPTVLMFDPRSYSGSGDLQRIQAGLLSLGLAPYVIQRELLDRPEARPGHQGEWEWRVTGFGRAVPIHKPSDLSWHKVGG